MEEFDLPAIVYSWGALCTLTTKADLDKIIKLIESFQIRDQTEFQKVFKSSEWRHLDVELAAKKEFQDKANRFIQVENKR